MALLFESSMYSLSSSCICTIIHRVFPRHQTRSEIRPSERTLDRGEPSPTSASSLIIMWAAYDIIEATELTLGDSSCLALHSHSAYSRSWLRRTHCLCSSDS